MGSSISWAMHVRPCALPATPAHIVGSLPVVYSDAIACIAGGKVIVFGHHHKVLDGIEQKLGKAYQAMRIDGSTSMEMRKKAMDDFQQKASVRLAILSITAAGVRSHLDMLALAHAEFRFHACMQSFTYGAAGLTFIW